MHGNTFGRIFRVTSWGESHGKALGAIIDGCPAGLSLDDSDFESDMARRQGGEQSFSTPRKESDIVRIESGVFEGKTTGTPIALRIENANVRSKDYLNVATTPRPGHADITTEWKHGHRDYRGGGRSSARETAARVAAGVIAKKVTAHWGVNVFAYLSRVGAEPIVQPFSDLNEWTTTKFVESLPELLKVRDSNVLRSLAADESSYLEKVKSVKAEMDSLGGEISVLAINLPRGLGEPVFDKLNAVIAHALFSLPATTSVELGGGTPMAEARGSEIRDGIAYDASGEIGFLGNKHGGLLGGMSSGNPLCARVKFHGPTSIPQSINTVDLATKQNKEILVEGRHDSFPLPRAVPVVEAMISIALADMCLLQKSAKL